MSGTVNAATGPSALSFDSRSASRIVFIVGASLALVFVLLDYHVNYGRLTDIGALRRLTNIAREDGLASWFASTQTLLVGLTAWTFWMASRARGDVPWRRAGWLLVAVLFTYMAVDDGAQLHERFATAFDTWREQDAGLVGQFPSYTWQVWFLPLFGTLGLLSGLFLWRELANRTSTLLLASAFLLLVTAVGLDFFEGLDEDHGLNVYSALVARFDLAAFTRARFRQEPYEALRHFSRSLEECFEMLAMTSIWTAILRGGGAYFQGIRLVPAKEDGA